MEMNRTTGENHLSERELCFLEDALGAEVRGLKKCQEYAEAAQDERTRQLFRELTEIHHRRIDMMLTLLKAPGDATQQAKMILQGGTRGEAVRRGGAPGQGQPRFGDGEAEPARQAVPLQGGESGGRFGDADRLADCLCSCKDRAMLYAHGALESANNGVREFFLALHGEEMHNQEVLFHFMHSRGLYPVAAATMERVREVRQRFQAIHDQLGLPEPPQARFYRTADPVFPPAAYRNQEPFEYKETH
jgi:hypothetical protein